MEETLAGGTLPTLGDVLTSSVSKPVLVFNEGIGGTTLADGLGRLGATMSRHQNSLIWLILFGTNDAGSSLPPLSGKGLSSGQSGYTGSFKDMLEQLTAGLESAGKIVVIGKIPIALGPCSSCAPYANPESATRNELVREYNEVIDEVVSEKGLIVSSPDFYTFYKNNQSQMADNLHPSGTGYRSMGDLWAAELLASGVVN